MMKPSETISTYNRSYVAELYERFLKNPESVDPQSRDAFAHWRPGWEGDGRAATPALEKIVGAVNLAQAIRGYGHLAAQLDPLGTAPCGDPSLAPAAHGISEEDLRALPASLIGGPIAERSRHALEAIQTLRTVYSARTGFDHDHVHIPEERQWLREAAESGRYRSPRALIDFKALLVRLTQIEALERFLHRVFPGKTRFSIEGVDMLVPILDEVIAFAAESGLHKIFIGMAHRGRLNVLAHILNKPYAQILAEFKDAGHVTDFQMALGWTGDVKYHRGASRMMMGREPLDLMIAMAPNPSHLEAVNPVIEGMARAAGTRVSLPGRAIFERDESLPVLIHGDASFPGQGVVAETLNLSRLAAYQTGGTLHLIANNQLGYTASAVEERSTIYASDLAKGFEIPIIHVNADDPEACLEAALIALDYRERFHKDFLIDLSGYRRHGHNEGDEPSFTQPLLYQKIGRHPTVRELWARTLVARQVIEESWPGELERQRFEELQNLLESLNVEASLAEPGLAPPTPGTARRIKTAVTVERLRALNRELLRLPNGFELNPKLKKTLARRTTALDNPDEPMIDWSLAEALALASLLEDGIAIRMTGQDVERGTFSQRHAVLHDVSTERSFTPLADLPQARAAFEIGNSPLSENAAIGFEYGYNVQAPGRLVIWEAQYGDFINGGQVMVDEFVCSARAKWGQTPSLVLLLPHGYEGQGPDHSNARLERFVGQAADFNIRIANCTSAAQYFHLLRRQALLLTSDPLPLIVMTPKSLLRHPDLSSTPRELSEGKWREVIDDAPARANPGPVRRLILCSGKIYIDLTGSEASRQPHAEIAIVRIEQIYPFPAEDLRALLEGYPNLKELLWVQEEPETMGAWLYMRQKLGELFGARWPIHYIGRPRGSSPAEGSAAWHGVNQRALIEQAFNLQAEFGDSHIWLKKF